MRAEQQDIIRRTYARRFSPVAGYRERLWATLTEKVFARYLGHTVLDLGCGWGEFINHADVPVRYGMDANPDTACHLSPEVTFIHHDCAQPWPIESATIDTVFTSNFLEHLPHKAAMGAVLDEAFRCLKPGGTMVCMGPNIRYLHGSYWDFWDHYVPLSDLSMREALELAGFEVKECRPRFMPYRIVTAFPPPLWAVRLYLRLPIAWRFIGKQFLVVAAKPALK